MQYLLFYCRHQKINACENQEDGYIKPSLEASFSVWPVHQLNKNKSLFFGNNFY